MLGACDSLMESMKEVCPSLQGVYERSDAMLAVYPGEGARFAKHIDNSTGMCPNNFVIHCMLFFNILASYLITNVVLKGMCSIERFLSCYSFWFQVTVGV